MAEALARIHAIPVEPALGLGQPDQLADFEAFLDDLGMAHPALELGLRWLRTNPPTPGRSAVVHGDFRIGNLIVDPDGLAAVIDWELAHVGDPLEDLGWVSMRAWRFGSRLEVGGFADREEFLDAYEAAAGVSVDRSAVHWWEVMGTFKWGVMAMIQASAHLMGVSRSVELAAIGRRVAETEYDLLRLLP